MVNRILKMANVKSNKVLVIKLKLFLYVGTYTYIYSSSLRLKKLQVGGDKILKYCRFCSITFSASLVFFWPNFLSTEGIFHT